MMKAQHRISRLPINLTAPEEISPAVRVVVEQAETRAVKAALAEIPAAVQVHQTSRIQVRWKLLAQIHKAAHLI